MWRKYSDGISLTFKKSALINQRRSSSMFNVLFQYSKKNALVMYSIIFLFFNAKILFLI